MATYKPPLYGLSQQQYNLAISSGPLAPADAAKRSKLLKQLNTRKRVWRANSQTSSSTPSTSTTVAPTTSTTVAPTTTTTPKAKTKAKPPKTPKYEVFQEKMFNQAYVALRQMSLAKRLETLQLLKKKGFGSGADVSPSGITSSDIARYADLLIFKDVSNLPLADVMDKVRSLKDVVDTAAAKATPIKDVDSIFDEVMKRDLGRSATQEELIKFRSAYSGMESGGNAPSLGAAAESQIETANPEESKAAKFANYAETFENMLRGA
jgi:hypothetical protein